MQYLDLNGPDPEEQAASLTARHLLTPEQAASLDLEQVRRFLASPLAQRIRRAEQVYREYRFSLLLPAALYDPAAEPEDELMLQGVVDCAFRTEQGLVIVDFKTDRIRPEEAPARAELYRPQLTAYSQALSWVLETPVAEMVLYFFAPRLRGQTVKYTALAIHRDGQGLYTASSVTIPVTFQSVICSEAARWRKGFGKNCKFFHILLVKNP